MKVCSRCRIEKHLEDYPRDRTHSDGRASMCKPCFAKRCADWRAKNRERSREINRKASRKKYAKDPDLHNARVRDWGKRHPENLLAIKARRRAREKILAVPVSRDYIIERDGGVCHICGKKPPRHLIELDHLVPLSKGGNHTPENLAVSCATCNRKRGPGRLPAQMLLVG